MEILWRTEVLGQIIHLQRTEIYVLLKPLVFINELTLWHSQAILCLNHERENSNLGSDGMQIFTRLKIMLQSNVSS